MIPTAESPDVFGNTVFCDDIRKEVDGKVSYIGAYPADLHVNASFPVTLPKFGFAVSLFQRAAVFQGNIALRIYFPGDEDDEPSFESLLDAPAPPNKDDLAGSFITMRAQIVLVGLVIKAAGTIKIRALRDGMLYPLGSLPITQGAAPAESPQAPQP